MKRPLTIHAYALDFPSGKLWVAEQAQSIANRYISRSAIIVVRRIHEAIISGDPGPLTRLESQEKLPVHSLPDWNGSTEDMFYLGEKVGERVKEEETFNDLRSWNRLS